MKIFGDTAITKLLNLIKTKFNSLAKVATSGSYTDLSNRPTIPTKLSELTNDKNFITASDNAATATKLKTPHTINSTSFDGSADITTAKWGTARTIKIGDSSKSVDGSLDVTWGRNEIGAVYGWEKYGETPSTAGWYRVAQSVKHINDNIGTFYIQNGLGGSHTVASINAGIAFGWSDGVTLIQTACSYYGRMGITKARIVYNTTIYWFLGLATFVFLYFTILHIWGMAVEIPKHKGDVYVDYDSVWFEGQASKWGIEFIENLRKSGEQV